MKNIYITQTINPIHKKRNTNEEGETQPNDKKIETNLVINLNLQF